MKFKPTKLVKIERGYRGQNKYQYGSQVIVIHRSVYCIPMAYALPNISSGDEIFTGQRFENMTTFRKRLRLHLEKIEKELIDKQKTNDKA